MRLFLVRLVMAFYLWIGTGAGCVLYLVKHGELPITIALGAAFVLQTIIYGVGLYRVRGNVFAREEA